MCERISDPMMETDPPPVRRNSTNPTSLTAISQSGRGFHTVPGGIDPGSHYRRPRFVGVAEIWKVL